MSPWPTIRQFFRLLELIRFSVLALLAGAIMAIFVEQIHEAIRTMAEDASFGGRIGPVIWFYIMAFLCSLSVWYTARVMFRFEFPGDDVSDKEQFVKTKKYLPRILGTLIPVFLVVALLLARVNSSRPDKLSLLTVSMMVLAVIVYAVVTFRRQVPILSSRWGITQYDQERLNNNLTSLRQLPRVTKLLLIAALVCNLILLIGITFFTNQVATYMGANAIILAGGATIVPVGSAVVYFGNRYQVPMITISILLIAIFSFFNDNHLVRLYPGMLSHDPPDQSKMTNPYVPFSSSQENPLRSYLRGWSDRRRKECPDQDIPLIIVSSEGGGIRAAYWTAAVLGHLEDQIDTGCSGGFSRHVFAISGVSGGSLGASTYTALLQSEPNGSSPDLVGCQRQSHRCRAKRVLSEDFFSPVISAMLFSDFAQRLWPVPVFDDRSIALEESWEIAWDRYEKPGIFTDSYTELWRNHQFDIPLLLFNSTVVITGQRLITSPIAFEGEQFNDVFNEALDGARTISMKMPLSTAVHNSARFTYVSPSGTVQRRDKPDLETQDGWIRLVDGGYFENSGTVTASEVLLGVNEWLKDTPGSRFKPAVLIITNDPGPKPRRFPSEKRGRRYFLGETLSPLIALISTRPARGFQATAMLEDSAEAIGGEGAYVTFETYNNEVSLPLGWSLSELTERDLDHQLLGYPEDQRHMEDGTLKPDNQASVRAVEAWFR